MWKIVVLALPLAGCFGPPATIGNERGGSIEWFATNERAVFDAASAHCAKYGKSPRITEMRKEAGGHVLFECS